MRVYKNLSFAYSFEIIVGLTTVLLIIFFGFPALSFLAFFALRPLLIETKEVSAEDHFWFISYQLMKYSIFVISFIIILFYIIYKFFLDYNFLWQHRDKIIMLFPFLLLVHGILGLFSLKGD
jgi:hypothetical protein